MFEAERARTRQSWRENALKDELAKTEEREWSAEIDGEEHMRFLGYKLRKVKESWAKHDAEVHEMETNTNKALE